ncbi:MAG: hypothetical protein WCV72_02570 [Patescibacteria group bacterium]
MDPELLIAEYKEKRPIYEECVIALKSLLEGLLDKEVNYQVVQARAKEVISLKKNFENKDKYKNIKDLDDIPDLAGCRIIFYLRSDLQKFLGILDQEFEGRFKDKQSDEKYSAYHFIGVFKKPRSELPEYTKFDKIKFEIQLTTVMFHAWNELEHDILYKNNEEIKKKFPYMFEKLGRIAGDVMLSLNKAQEDWEYITEQYNLARRAPSKLDLFELKLLAKSNNNNEIYAWIDSIKKDVESLEEAPKITEIKKLFDALYDLALNSKTNKIIKETTPFGVWEGKNHCDVVVAIVALINQLKYQAIDYAFRILIKLFFISESEAQNNITECIKRTTTYNINVIKKQGCIVQEIFLNEIKNNNISKRLELLPLICGASSSILSASYEATTTDFKDGCEVINFSSGSLPADKNIKNIRNKWIFLLKQLYLRATTYSQKRVLLQAFSCALYASSHGGEIREIVKDSTDSVSRFYANIASKESLNLLLHIEGQFLIAERVFGDEGLPALAKLSETLNSNPEYDIYRALVGWDFRHKKNSSIDDERAVRSERVEEYLTDISAKTFNKWQRRIVKFAGTNLQEKDSSKFLYFKELLLKIGVDKPILAIKLLKNKHKHLREFMSPLMQGVWQSNKQTQVERMMSNWIRQGLYLFEITIAMCNLKGRDTVNLLKEIFKKSKSMKRRSEKINILVYILRKIGFCDTSQKEFLLQIIEELNKEKYYKWVNEFYEQDSKKTILKKFKKSDWERISYGFIKINHVDDYHLPHVLQHLIRNYPKMFTHLLMSRIQFQQSMRGLVDSRYSDIPRSNNYWTDALHVSQKPIIDEILKWLDQIDTWKVGYTLHSLYPGLCDHLVDRIHRIIDNGKHEESKELLHGLTSWYSGDVITEIILYAIKKLPSDERMWNDFIVHIANPGGVSGLASEPIMANAYRRKLAAANNWKIGKNKKLHEFIIAYKEYLIKGIESEERDHRRGIQRRKRRYES